MIAADSHCHLTMKPFDEDRERVLARAAAEGVALLVTVPARKGDGPACVALAESDRRIWATAGLHPHEASAWDDAARAELREALGSPRVVAVGEIGFDLHYNKSPKGAQERAFREQIAIAREAGRPIVIHTRNAVPETLAVLREENARDLGGVLHCFTENAAAAKALLDLGFYISFSGIATFPKATDIQESARLVPLDRILVETDAPFLAPVPHRGRRNEPAFVTETIRFLAAQRREDPEALAARSLENCRTAFRLPAG
jgi:TatD DNase family protein